MPDYAEADYDQDDADHEPEADPDEGYEMQIECPYCDGEGWMRTRPTDGDGTISMECPECGGTGWQ